MLKKILIIGGALLIAVLLAGGSFYGGMAYQRNQADQIRTQFLASRGLNGGDVQFFENGNFQGAPGNNNGTTRRQGGFAGGGVAGQVKSIEGNVLTISTPQDVTTVNLSDSTRIEKPAEGTLADLQPGVRVVVNGERDAQGNMTASSITILNVNFGPPDVTPAP